VRNLKKSLLEGGLTVDIITKPLGMILSFIYNITNSYGLSIILFTILTKLLLLPLAIKQQKSIIEMQKVQPLLNEIQKKYKNDPQTMQAKTLELYKEAKYNPASGCLVLLIQIPIIFAFFKVMREPTVFAFKDINVYQAMNKTFLWIKNLENPDPFMWGLPLLAGITTYIQSATMSAVQDPKTRDSMKTMNIILPIFIFMAARSFPAGLALYWVVSNIFSIVQQLISNRSLAKVKEEN